MAAASAVHVLHTEPPCSHKLVQAQGMHLQELLPPDCNLPLTFEQLQQMPMVKNVFGSTPAPGITRQLAAGTVQEHFPTVTLPAHAQSGRCPTHSVSDTAYVAATHAHVQRIANMAETAKQAQPTLCTEQPPPAGAPPGQESQGPIRPVGNAPETQQSAAGGSDHFELAADWPPDPGRMRCTSVAQLIESWPNEEWCPAPLYAHLEDLVESVSVAATTGTTMNVAGHLYLCSATLAALRSASQSLMPDEALMYTLCTFAGPGCWVAFCELIWKGDAAYCSMALRVPSPIYSKTSGPFAKPPPNMSGVQVARVFNNAVGYSGVQPVAPFRSKIPYGLRGLLVYLKKLSHDETWIASV
jgi:hypothetical protein